MMRSRAWFVAFAVAAWALSGCATVREGSVSVTRMARSSLRSQDVVGVVVLGGQKGQGKKIAGCVRDSLRGTDVRVVQFSDVFTGTAYLPYEGEEGEDFKWQALFSDSGFRANVASLGLSHLAILSVSEYEGLPKTKTEFAAGGSAPVFALGVGTVKALRASLDAAVVDLRSRRLAARVSATGSGSSEQGVILVYFLVPVPYWSNVSAFDPACKSIGTGVAASLVHMTSDPDEVRGCALLEVVKDDDWGDMVKKVLKLRGNTVLLPAGNYTVYTKKFSNAPARRDWMGRTRIEKVEGSVYSCESERGKTK